MLLLGPDVPKDCRELNPYWPVVNELVLVGTVLLEHHRRQMLELVRERMVLGLVYEGLLNVSPTQLVCEISSLFKVIIKVMRG